MKKQKIRTITLGIELVVSLLFIVAAVALLISVASVEKRPLSYNASLPVFSRIVISTAGLNIISILEFLVIEMITIASPIICFELSGDGYKSASLCLMPVALWGIMAFASYMLAPVNDEIAVFLVSAFLHTIVSIVMYLRHLYKAIWHDDDDCDDESEEYEY